MAYDAVNMADWQISEAAEANMPTPEQWQEKLGLQKEEMLPMGRLAKIDFLKVIDLQMQDGEIVATHARPVEVQLQTVANIFLVIQPGQLIIGAFSRQFLAGIVQTCHQVAQLRHTDRLQQHQIGLTLGLNFFDQMGMGGNNDHFSVHQTRVRTDPG